MSDLERFRAGYQEWATSDAGDEDNVHAYIEALEAEVERMRDALRQVRSLTNYSAVYDIARAALAGEGAEDDAR